MDLLLDSPTTQPPDTLAGEQAIRTLAVRFTGTGAAWFRLWIVDLALVVATGTLYAPVARARRIAWFRRHTCVGRDALVFHAVPSVPCALYVAALGLLAPAGWLAWQGSPLATAPLALLLLCTPAAWWAARRWRWRHTVWRGVRLDHAGGGRRAYAVWWPALAWGLALLGWLTVALASIAPPWLLASTGAVLLAVAIGGLPWWLARLLRHRQGALAWGHERARLLVDLRRLRAGLRQSIGLAASCVLLVGLAAAGALRWWPPAFALPLVGVLAVGVGIVVWAWVAARLQNLLWSHTWSPRARGRSELRWQRLCGEALSCAALVAVTSGLYLPFAQVRLARCRLEALAIDLDGELPPWGARAPSTMRSVTQGRSRAGTAAAAAVQSTSRRA